MRSFDEIRKLKIATLLTHSPIWVVAHAARKCSGTVEKRTTKDNAIAFSPEDRRVIEERCLKIGHPIDVFDQSHESVVEHLSYTFEINYSRAVLQELARTRIGISLSVESTRFAFKRIIEGIDPEDLSEIKKMMYLTGDKYFDDENASKIASVIKRKLSGAKNDVIKYGLPECFMSSAIITLNVRSLRHLFALRTSTKALEEYRELCYAMAGCIPIGHRFLFEDRINFTKKVPEGFTDFWSVPEWITECC